MNASLGSNTASATKAGSSASSASVFRTASITASCAAAPPRIAASNVSSINCCIAS